MKHLKRIFEGKTMIDTNNLGDILQEITDLGYLSHVESSWWSQDDRKILSEYVSMVKMNMINNLIVKYLTYIQMRLSK
jgi:hypothetical protein